MPQLENGFTRIANELLEATYKYKFNATQLSIILCVWRFTYGYQRKSHSLALTYISEATGIHKKQVQREMNTLFEKNVLLIETEATNKHAREIGINKDYSSWDIEFRGSELVPSRGSELVPSTTVPEVADSLPKKESINSLNKKERNIYTGGESQMAMTEEAKGILAYLNEKKGSKYRPTPNTLKLIQGRLSEGYTVEDCKHVINVKIADWLGTENEKYLDYETLFRPSKFPKYLEQKMNQVAVKKNNGGGKGYKNKTEQTHSDVDALNQLFLDEVNQNGVNNEGSNSRVIVDDQNRLPEFR